MTDETTGSEPRDGVTDEAPGTQDQGGPSRVEQARQTWAVLPTRYKVQGLVGLGLSLLGAATVVRLGTRVARAGYRRVRR